MIRPILLLFLCQIPVLAQPIREQTQRHLAAMNNMTVKQIVDGKANRVAIFDGRQVPNRELPTPKFGLLLGSAWYSILEDSQRWNLHPQGDHFTYSTGCLWFEISRQAFSPDSRWEGWVPCEGKVFVDKTNIIRITQQLIPNRLTKTVTIDIHYGWIQLKELRLLPSRMIMDAVFKNGKTSHVEVLWTDYREFGSELLAKEIDPDDPPVITIAQPPRRNFFDDVEPGEERMTRSTERTSEKQTSAPPPPVMNLPLRIDQAPEAKTVGVRTWKRIFRPFLK
jgi:hypothetical protein